MICAKCDNVLCTVQNHHPAMAAAFTCSKCKAKALHI